MKLFVDMNWQEQLTHIEECQREGLEEIRDGSPACLADISDHLDLWGPWMVSEIRRLRAVHNHAESNEAQGKGQSTALNAALLSADALHLFIGSTFDRMAHIGFVSEISSPEISAPSQEVKESE